MKPSSRDYEKYYLSTKIIPCLIKDGYGYGYGYGNGINIDRSIDSIYIEYKNWDNDSDSDNDNDSTRKDILLELAEEYGDSSPTSSWMTLHDTCHPYNKKQVKALMKLFPSLFYYEVYYGIIRSIEIELLLERVYFGLWYSEPEFESTFIEGLYL